MRTDLMFDTIEKILPDICALFDDPELETIKADIRSKKAVHTKDILPRIVPAFIRNHRDETVRIIAAISGKAPEDIVAQEFSKTVKDANGGGFDQILDFFGWCLHLALKM